MKKSRKSPQAGKGISTPEELHELAMAFQKSRIVLAAFKLDVFSAIGGESLPSAEIASRIKADARGTDRLLNALCALGLLEKKRGIFSNTKFSLRYLRRGGEEYLAGLGHSANLYQSWATLDEAVREGGSVLHRSHKERSGDSLEYFIAAMHQRARLTAHVVVSKMDLSGVKRVLDVGGGSGMYSMAFARASEGLEAVVFDLPGVTGIAERYIASEGLSDRISTKGGNYLTDDLGAGYDLVFISAVMHINSYEENRMLASKAYKALNPGGRIAIQDQVMDEDRVHPEGGAVFALNMLVNTPHGDTYTESEIRQWLADAGFRDIRRIETVAGNALMIGTKS